MLLIVHGVVKQSQVNGGSKWSRMVRHMVIAQLDIYRTTLGVWFILASIRRQKKCLMHPYRD